MAAVRVAQDGLVGVPYTSGLYRELSPVFLNYVAALSGYRPLPLDGGFAYCELGCGNGVTINGLAEVFPKGEFHAVDHDPQFVANTQALADDAGSRNLTVHHAAFDALNDESFPEFDFITLHGVYSWIDPEARDAARRFIGAKIKPGGIVYVSYNAFPGWAALLPLREAMQAHTLSMGGDTLARTRAGLDYLIHLRDIDAGYFQDHPTAAAFLDDIAGHDVRYLAHEFFADAHKPYYFSQVAAEMRSAGLNFAGNADTHLNFLDLAVAPEFHDLLRHVKSRNDFETQGDFIRNQRFRKDVYVHGHETMDAEEQLAVLSGMVFGTNVAPAQFNRQARFGEVTLTYEGPVFDALIDVLGRGAKPVSALAGMPEFADCGPDLLVDGVKFLVAGGQAFPFAHTTETPPTAAAHADRYRLPSPFNIAMLKRGLFDGSSLGMVSGPAGTGLEMSMSDALFALCLAEAPADQVVDWAHQRALEANQEIVMDGGSAGEALNAALTTFRETRLSKFIELGILEPAAP
jgi:hypothetical protein